MIRHFKTFFQYYHAQSSITHSLPLVTQSYMCASLQNRSILSSLRLQSIRSIFIETEATPNPQSLKFLPGKDVLGNSVPTLDFPSSTHARAYPLAKSIFEIEGVTRVFFGTDFISVSVDKTSEWSTIKSYIFSTITEFYASGKPVIPDSEQMKQSDTAILDDDSDAVVSIKEILEQSVKPAVQEDGGDIKFISFNEKTGVVYLQLQGACSGCPSSSGTLKTGIQNMMRHYIPEVTSVEEWVEEDEDIDGLSQLADKLRKINKS